MVLKAAWIIETVGAEAACNEISMIKALVSSVLCRVSDRAIQTYGAMELSPDTPLAEVFTFARALRFADGPDEVHLRALSRMEIKASAERFGASAGYMTPAVEV